MRLISILFAGHPNDLSPEIELINKYDCDVISEYYTQYSEMKDYLI